MFINNKYCIDVLIIPNPNFHWGKCYLIYDEKFCVLRRKSWKEINKTSKFGTKSLADKCCKFSPPVLWVHTAERHTDDWIMSSEEHSEKHLKVNNLYFFLYKTDMWLSFKKQIHILTCSYFNKTNHIIPALAVCQCNALSGHFKVDDCGRGSRVTWHCCSGCFSNGLRSCKWLCLYWVQVQHIAGWWERWEVIHHVRSGRDGSRSGLKMH